MAGLLKAIENGYKPTPREIIEELEEIPREDEYDSFFANGFARTGANNKEDFISRLFNLLGVQL